MNLDQKLIGTRWTHNFFKTHSILSIRKAQTLLKNKTLFSKQDVKNGSKKWFKKKFKCCGLYPFLLENLDLKKVPLSVQEYEIQTNPKGSAKTQLWQNY